MRTDAKKSVRHCHPYWSNHRSARQGAAEAGAQEAAEFTVCQYGITYAIGPDVIGAAPYRRGSISRRLEALAGVQAVGVDGCAQHFLFSSGMKALVHGFLRDGTDDRIQSAKSAGCVRLAIRH
jgi:hypothetical protein